MWKGSFQENFSKSFILLLLNFISRTIKQMRLKAPNTSRKDSPETPSAIHPLSLIFVSFVEIWGISEEDFYLAS